MAALDVGNGPVEGHAVSSNGKARFGQKWKQEGSASCVRSPVTSRRPVACNGFNVRGFDEVK